MLTKENLARIEKWNNDPNSTINQYLAEHIVKGQIVFYGPSNFTRWSTKYGMTPLREALLGKSGNPCCINRGFGTSASEEHLYYYHSLVRPLEPKVLVYAPGIGNGLTAGFTAQQLFESAQRVVLYAQTDFPDIRIYILGLPLQRDLMFKGAVKTMYVEYDNWLREFAEKTPNCTYLTLSTYTPIHRNDIYVEDHVHFNQEGYKLYADFFREVLKEELEQY